MARKIAGSRAEVLFPLAAVILDLLAVLTSFGLAYWLRFYSPLTKYIPVTLGIPPLKQYWFFSLVAAAIFLVVFAARGLYRLHDRISTLDEFLRVIKSTLLVLPWLFTLAFFYRDFSYSRAVFALIALLAIVILTAERALIKSLQRKLYRRGFGVLSAAICGTGPLAKEIQDRLRRNPHLGYHNLGFIAVSAAQPEATPLLGSVEHISEILLREDPDLLFIALETDEKPFLDNIIKQCEGIDLDFLYAPDQVVVWEGKVQPWAVAGIPFLRIKESPLFGWKGVVKRGFDLVASSSLLLLASPLMLVITLLIKLTSKGPLFYAQDRVGLDSRSFNILKFRTMIPEAESQTGPVWAKKGDTRTTVVGRYLRRFSLDELPQFLNVLKGDMSLVGPRPERPHFVAQFQRIVPHYLERHRVRSGITGWAQVNGLRGDTSIAERTRYDLYYVENWSLGFDLKIILMTLKEVFFGKQAY